VVRDARWEPTADGRRFEGEETALLRREGERWTRDDAAWCGRPGLAIDEVEGYYAAVASTLSCD